MQQTRHLRIAGAFFIFEVDAYHKLKNYLTLLQHELDSHLYQEDILSAIQNHIKELLEEKQYLREVFTINDVDRVLTLIGSPIADKEAQETEKSFYTLQHHIYRDMDRRNMAGVAGGIAAYWGVDIVLVRIMFLLLLAAFGIGILIYLIAWIVIPAADTPQQKLTLGKERIKRKFFRDLDNGVIGGVCAGLDGYIGRGKWVIRAIIVLLTFYFAVGIVLYLVLWFIIPIAKTTSQKLLMQGKRINMVNIKKLYEKPIVPISPTLGFINEAVDSSFTSFQQIGTQLGKFTGITTLLVSSVSLIAIISLFWYDKHLTGHNLSNNWIPNISVFSLCNSIFNRPLYSTMFLVGIAAVTIPSLFAIWYKSVRTVFNIPNRIAFIDTLSTILLVLGLVVVFALIGITTLQFTSKAQVLENIAVNNVPSLTITSDLQDPILLSNKLKIGKINVYLNEDVYVTGNSILDIKKSPSNNFQLYAEKIGYGKSKLDAYENTHKLGIQVQQKDNTLLIHPEFLLGNTKWRNQQLKLVLEVPEGKKIFLDPSIQKLVNKIPNVNDYAPAAMIAHTWQMTNRGLYCLDCR